MATIGSLKTLLDWSKEVDPDGNTSAVAELLSQENGLVRTMLWKEGNLPTGERVSQRTGLPTSYWRLVNRGVPVGKATSAQVDFQAGMLEARSEIDKAIVQLNGNTADFRAQEARAHMESMNQGFSTGAYYGTAANPEEIVGLASQYNSLSADNARNILDCEGSTATNNTSVWLLGWGDNSIYGAFPKGSMAGLEQEDLGIIDAFDDDNNRFRAYAEWFCWRGCIVVKDWRYGVRVCNIDLTELAAGTLTQAPENRTNILYKMSEALGAIQSTANVRPVFYANRSVLTYLGDLGLDKSQNAVTVQDALGQFGETIQSVRFRGVPVELDEALVNTEDPVT